MNTLKVGEIYRFEDHRGRFPGLLVWRTMSFDQEASPLFILASGDRVLLLAIKPPEEHKNAGAIDCDALQMLTSDGKLGWAISTLQGLDLFVPAEDQ